MNCTAVSTNSVTSGQASFTTSVLPAGACVITAEYGGDANHLGSTNNPAFSQTVNPAPTTTLVSSSVNPSQLGSNVVFTATVTSDAGTPCGSAQFVINGSNAGLPVVLSDGQVDYATAELDGGDHAVAVDYFGAPNFATCSGALVQAQNVNRPPTAPTIAASVYAGGTLRFNILASPNSPALPSQSGRTRQV